MQSTRAAPANRRAASTRGCRVAIVETTAAEEAAAEAAGARLRAGAEASLLG